jgi:two-component system chemotaxis response regulator CheB
VIGCSWGGLSALSTILAELPGELPAAVAVVQHRRADSRDDAMVQVLARASALPVRSVEDKDPILAGTVHLAPPDYHLLVEDGSFALSIDERVHFSRPSIDVLFESAARAYGPDAIGVVLTGANADGAAGLREISRCGGHGVVQDPADAERPVMPRAAVAAGGADDVLPLAEIAGALVRLCRGPARRDLTSGGAR